MKKLILIAAAITLPVLAACTPTEDTPHQVTTQPAPATNSAIEDVYLSVLHEEGIDQVSDKRLLVIGHAVCTTLDNELEPDVFFLLGISYGAGEELGNNDDGAYLTGVAVGAFCPQYSHLIEG